jgi:hypothetical protein
MSTSSPKRRPTAAEIYFYTELRSSLGNMVAEHWLSETSSSSCAGSRRVSSVANTPTAAERRKNDPLKRSSSIQDSRSPSQAPSLSRLSAADTPRALSRSFSSESLASVASDIERFSSSVLHKRHSVMLKSRIMSHSFLVRKHGEKAGLLFTDAAHELLDYFSPVVSRCCSVVSRCCSSESALADPKVSAGADVGRSRGRSMSRRRSSSSSHNSHSSEYESNSHSSEYESDPSLCRAASWCRSTRRNSVSNDDCFRSSVSNDDCYVGFSVLIVVFLLLIIFLISCLFEGIGFRV